MPTPITHRPVCTACGTTFVSNRYRDHHLAKAKVGGLSRCTGVAPTSWNVRPPTGRFADAAADDYITPLWVWAELFAAIPGLRAKKLWDPFYCSGETITAWKSLGVRSFYHGKVDFFKCVRKVTYDVIVTNPPFSKKQLVLATLLSVGKPFILLLRTNVLFTLWFRRMLPSFNLVLPSRQVDFTGMAGQKLSFDAVFICVGCTGKRSLQICPRT
jgi:hypothetical protein